MAIILYPALANIFLFLGLGYFSISFILLFYKCVFVHDRRMGTDAQCCGTGTGTGTGAVGTVTF